MAGYRTGAGASFLFVMLFTSAAGLLSHWEPFFHVLPIIWAYAFVINYLGCILGWLLLRCTPDHAGPLLRILLFALLGYAFGELLSWLFLNRWMVAPPFIWTTIPGALVYLWGHTILRQGPMRHVLAYGPLVLLALSFPFLRW